MNSRRCPICERETNAAFAPFCSKRCADVDLNRWLKGAYVIPGRDEDMDGDADPPSPPGAAGQPGRGPL